MSGEWWGASDDDQLIRTIHRALELGVDLIDAAEGYGNGHSVEVVGPALIGRRQDAVIADKVDPEHLEPDLGHQVLTGRGVTRSPHKTMLQTLLYNGTIGHHTIVLGG